MDRITFKEYMDIMSEGWSINLSDTKHITRVGNKFFFIGNGEEYVTLFNHIDKENWSIKFGRVNGGDINIDMVGGLKSEIVKDILSNVAKSLVMFIKSNKPGSVSYIADRRSRKIAYLHLVSMLLMKPEVMRYYLENKQDTYYYIIKNDVKVEDVIPTL